SAAEDGAAPEPCDAINSGEMYAFVRLPPVSLRINGISGMFGMFDCTATSGWTVNATIGVELVAARALALTGSPPAMNSRCVGALTGASVASKNVPSVDRKLVPL